MKAERKLDPSWRESNIQEEIRRAEYIANITKRWKPVLLDERLSRVRQHLCLTLDEVSKMTALSKFAIDKWERGVSQPSLTSLGRLALAYRMPIDVLVGIYRDDLLPPRYD